MSSADFKPVIQETVDLPSKGQLNPELPASFEIRPLTVNEMKMLYGSGSPLNALNNILRAVVNVPDFPVDKLHVGDKLYLAYRLRAITFGEDYRVSTYCPACQKRVETSLNLLEAEMDTLPDGFSDPRDIGKLPVCGDSISLKVMRSGDIEKVYKRAQEIKRLYPEYIGDPMYPLSLAAQIYSINGKPQTNSRDLENYVLKLHAKDDFFITTQVAKVKNGPRATQVVSCPDCGQEIMIQIEMGEDFFRPGLE